MTRTYVWDPLVRIFHWSLVASFAANALITDPEGKLHRQVGYVVAGLIAVRLVWGLVGPRHARFADFPPSPGAALRQLGEMITGRVSRHVGHTPLGALMIYNLLLTLALIAGSGWLMTTDAFWGVEWVEEVHEVLVTWAEISVVGHVAAVVLESRRTGVNLPKAMISGYKDLPQPQTVSRPDP